MARGPDVIRSRKPEDSRAGRWTRAFSSEVGTGSREENASKQKTRAPFRFHRNGNGSGLLRWLGAATGLLGAGLGTGAAPVTAQQSDYRAAATAPAAWQQFSKQLQDRFQQRLAADDAGTRRFQDDMTKRAGAAKATPASVIARTWILPDGKIERIEFDGLDSAVAVNLRALLSRGDVGMPPSDMLPPVLLRLSLRPNSQPGQGG
jgi:hypothetical protein